jgi:hypothetical protein
VDNRTYFSQHFGASFTSKSIVISPADVSNSTDMLKLVLPQDQGWIDGSEVGVDLFRVHAMGRARDVAPEACSF